MLTKILFKAKKSRHAGNVTAATRQEARLWIKSTDKYVSATAHYYAGVTITFYASYECGIWN